MFFFFSLFSISDTLLIKKKVTTLKCKSMLVDKLSVDVDICSRLSRERLTHGTRDEG